jgi:predicted RNase H-like HicB family nuclease
MMPREKKMTMKYIIYREEKYYVAQCLNVDVSSFGETIQEAQENLKEAVELYFENEAEKRNYIQIGEVLIGETTINA